MRVVAVCLVVLAACQGAPPNLSSTEQDAVTMPVTSHDFAMVQVGQTSAAYTFTINPAAGNNSDTVESVTESCPDFSVNATGLPAVVYRDCETCCLTLTGDQTVCPSRPEAPLTCCTVDLESYSFDTYFSPTVAGTVSCTVTVSLDGGATTKLVTLTGTGTPPPIHISVQPSSVAFGDVRVNNDSTAVGVNVGNTGGTTMTVSSTSISPGFAITAGPTGAFNVGPGGSQPLSLTCHPTATGPLSGSLVITSNDPTSPTTIPLTCNGINSNLTIAPSPIDMSTRVGEPAQATIALTNSGAAAMTIESVSVTGQDLSMTSGPSTMTLGGGVSTNITISFAAASKEVSSGTVVVTYDGGQSRMATVTAKALATSMAINPDGDVDFGPVCAGQMKTIPFSIRANDDGPFQITAISAPSMPFQATMLPTFPAAVQGGGMTTIPFNVTAAPTAEGTQTSTMMVTTDIPGNTQHSIYLSVDALAAGVSATPPMIDFGSSPPLTTTIGQDVNLSNCGTAAITASNARIEGASADEFAIVQQPDSAMIAPTSSASWLVVMQPHSKGPKQASFVVDYDGGTAMVPLTGEGLGSDVGSAGSGGEKSYYSCAVGGGTAGWPIAAALALILRRRPRR